jgi:hypothetical protein
MLKRALAKGWILLRVNGSHHILQKDGEQIIIPVHGNKDLKKGLESSLRKQIGD